MTTKWYQIVFQILRFIWIIFNSTFVIFVHVLYMLLLSPLSWFGGENGKKLYWMFEDMFYGWILYIVDFILSSVDYKIVETGDFLDDFIQENILFMPNHQSVADVLICLSIFVARQGYAKTVMWVIGKNQKFTNFGLMSWLHDDCFLGTSRDNAEKALLELRHHLSNSFLRRNRQCLVLFPEGGFLSKKKVSSYRYAEKNKLPILHHCVYPRIGALEVILDELVEHNNDTKRIKELKHIYKVPDDKINEKEAIKKEFHPLTKNVPFEDISNITRGSGHLNLTLSHQQLTQNRKKLTKVIDVTLGYPNGKALSFFDIMLGLRKGCSTLVYYRVFNVNEIPTKDKDKLQTWMYKLYQEKDEMLKQFYTTGQFANSQLEKTTIRHTSTERQIFHQKWKYYIYNIFYLVSFLCFYIVLRLIHANFP